jgi:hypothetical protein
MLNFLLSSVPPFLLDSLRLAWRCDRGASFRPPAWGLDLPSILKKYSFLFVLQLADQNSTTALFSILKTRPAFPITILFSLLSILFSTRSFHFFNSLSPDSSTEFGKSTSAILGRQL